MNQQLFPLRGLYDDNPPAPTQWQNEIAKRNILQTHEEIEKQGRLSLASFIKLGWMWSSLHMSTFMAGTSMRSVSISKRSPMAA